MNTQQSIHYSKAPIVEAIIDLRIISPDDFTFEQLADIKNVLPSEYIDRESISTIYNNKVQVQVEQGKPSNAQATHKGIGYKFAHMDKKFILQARVDGFTLSVLAPYDRWETFREEAHRLWKIYASIIKVEHISRAAVRYINRIDISAKEPIELKDYLKTYLEVSSDYKFDLQTGVFAQVQIPQDDLDGMLVINEGSADPPGPEIISVLLDMDLFSERSTNPWLADDDKVWIFLEKLHVRKNEIFESSITDKTREMIK